MVLSMANTGNEELDGVVSFHGSLGLPIMPEEGKTETKVLVLNGADDPFITEEQINNYKEAMDEAGADYELINYENAKHAFTSLLTRIRVSRDPAYTRWAQNRVDRDSGACRGLLLGPSSLSQSG